MEEKTISVNGLQVNYKIAGVAWPLLMLHGWGRGSDSYVFVQEKIAKAGFQVIVPDLPGFGKTNPPKVAWGIDEYMDFAFEFAKVLGLQKFALLGHSFGGQVALKFAIMHTNMVDRLILYGAAVIRRKPGLKVQIVGYAAKAGNILFSIWPLSMVQSLARRMVYKALGSNDERYSKGIMKDIRKKILCQDLSALFGEVKIPTYILWGDQDDKTPVQDAYTIQENIHGSSLQVVKGAGHRIHQEVPEQFIDAVTSFLRSA